MMDVLKKTIAITLGDINGIGPEVTLKALQIWEPPAGFRVVLIGPASALKFWKVRLRLDLSLPHFNNLDEWRGDALVAMLDKATAVGSRPEVYVHPGQLSAEAGKHAGAALLQAIELAHARKVHAIVTAPVSKQALNLAGFHFPGQTELLADGFVVPDFAMMLVAGDLRVALVTSHLPLRQVPEALSQELILRRLLVLNHDLQTRFRIHAPRFAVTGLNPHAGEGGLLGDEEQNIIAPAIRLAREDGIAAEGPFSADALFGQFRKKNFDVYLAMYHDQGLIPLKMFGFGRAVNYTAGLPVIRTSPDHGTAFDIAGKGIADPTSMVEALQLAAHLLTQD
jgi:4-hydroxythreonine-4-phosphate dehydrogenase